MVASSQIAGDSSAARQHDLHRRKGQDEYEFQECDPRLRSKNKEDDKSNTTGGNGQETKMHQLPTHDVAAKASQPGLLAPDTTGMNFYRADPALTDLLRIHLSDALFRHIEPHLDRLGPLAGRHPPRTARRPRPQIPEPPPRAPL